MAVWSASGRARCAATFAAGRNNPSVASVTATTSVTVVTGVGTPPTRGPTLAVVSARGDESSPGWVNALGPSRRQVLGPCPLRFFLEWILSDSAVYNCLLGRGIRRLSIIACAGTSGAAAAGGWGAVSLFSDTPAWGGETFSGTAGGWAAPDAGGA